VISRNPVFLINIPFNTIKTIVLVNINVLVNNSKQNVNKRRGMGRAYTLLMDNIAKGIP
jgi:hypothetical protein